MHQVCRRLDGVRFGAEDKASPSEKGYKGGHVHPDSVESGKRGIRKTRLSDSSIPSSSSSPSSELLEMENNGVKGSRRDKSKGKAKGENKRT
ncbi:hypothetical protein ZHAS_00021229 [Anopheles sinensis]|uniref:Uncharacterized protein n=1 Tax=Anopheles sinensis TaxID=74873 RepID=A0A084WRV6_ANOSI|nr:hypothetical protein ZHAS_00021229 [Anopheles sinensis]